GEDLRPPGLDGLGQGGDFGDVRAGAPVVEPEQLAGNIGVDGPGAGQGEQAAQFFLGDPGGEQLAGGLVGGDLFPHAGERVIGEPLAAAEQPPPVRPGRVLAGAAAAQVLAGDPLPDPGHGLVSQPGQVEVVHYDNRA